LLHCHAGNQGKTEKYSADYILITRPNINKRPGSFLFFRLLFSEKMLLNRPNNVIANQRHFQAPSQTPLWIKGKRDKFIVTIVFAGLSVGVVGALAGCGR
jgi:hypothetical protein